MDRSLPSGIECPARGSRRSSWEPDQELLAALRANSLEVFSNLQAGWLESRKAGRVLEWRQRDKLVVER